MGRNSDGALSDGGIAHFNEALGAALKSTFDVPAKATISDNLRLARRQFTIEPGGALRCNLTLELFRRKDLNPRPITASRAIVGLATFKDISGDFPMVVVDPFDVSCATQGLQPADMRADKRLRILEFSFELLADTFQVPAGPVDSIVLAAIERDIAISGSRSGGGRNYLHDRVPSSILQMRAVGEFNVMDTAVDPVDH
jgi:uncharacterized metal-binding protein